MPATLTLGPLALPLDRLAAIVALWAFLGLSGLIGARLRCPAAGRGGWLAVLVGLAAARTAWVGAYWRAYAADPWSIPAFWQGGFRVEAGVAAAAVAILATVRPRRAAGVLLAALFGVALAYGAATMALRSGAERPLLPGLRLTTLDGRPLLLDRMRGRPFVLNLWAGWCPPCRREMPMVAQVAAQAPMPVLLVDQGEDAATVRAFLARQGLGTRGVVLDEGGAVARAGGATALPTTLFVDAAGRIRRRHVGEISRAALLAGMEELRR